MAKQTKKPLNKAKNKEVSGKDKLIKELLTDKKRIKLNGKTYYLRKWKLRKSLLYSATIADIVKEFASGFSELSFPKGEDALDENGKLYTKDASIAEIIQYFIAGLRDLSFTEVITKNLDSILDIITGTLEDCDEVSKEDIPAIIDSMEVSDLFEFIQEIIALNFLFVKDLITKVAPKNLLKK